MNWITKELEEEVRKIFQPKYNRELSKEEVKEIANNLTDSLETICKFRWKKEYEGAI